MKLQLYYQLKANNDINPTDYFNDVKAAIQPHHKYTVLEDRTIMTPVDISDLLDALKLGYQIIYRMVEGFGELPHYLIRELVLSFDIDSDNWEKERETLTELYGKKACISEIIEKIYLEVE